MHCAPLWLLTKITQNYDASHNNEMFFWDFRSGKMWKVRAGTVILWQREHFRLAMKLSGSQFALRKDVYALE